MWRVLLQATISVHLHEPQVPLANNISKSNVLKREYDAKMPPSSCLED
jgi:hypothetical protein